mgnify:CR=1 FL=1
MQVINVLSERQIHIISILLNTEGSISGVSLSKNLGITTRTLRNDISNINDEIKNKKVKIYSNPAHGYWIKKEDKKSMKKEIREIRNTIKQAIASTSDERIVMLFYLLIREKSLKTDKLVERFYVSKTTLNKDINKLKLIITYIENNYTHAISIQDIADECHFSESHFMKFFKQCTGTSFISYLNDYRLLIASRLLTSTDLPVTQIAVECGFDNISYFNRCFKKKYGEAPSKTR